MSASTADLQRWDHLYLWHPFTQMEEWLGDPPLVIAAGEGTFLIDTEGRRYVDGVASLWCNVHGHRHPRLDAALRAQIDAVAHSTLLGLSNVPSILLARRLADIAPAGLTRVFYSDAGATAVEIALKIAFQYWQLRGETRRRTFASLEGGYHGDTLGAVSVGYSETYHRFFRPLLFDVPRLRPPHLYRRVDGLGPSDAVARALEEADALLRDRGPELAALIVEPLVQGAAGMWVQPAGYLRGLRELTRRHGVPLICDEVATGFGRTGRLFACEHEDVAPDILCLGKGLTGGYLPLAATLVSEDIFSAFLAPYDAFAAFFHGHTYTGNPLACAVALENLDVFDQEETLRHLEPKITRVAEWLTARIAPLRHVVDARQQGLMIGIELAEDRDRQVPYPPAARIGLAVTREAGRHGVILRPLGDVIVLMPPLNIRSEELETLLDVTERSIRTVTESA